MRTRIYNKLNVKEIQKYLDEGGDTIFLPGGVIECHGALPVDCESVYPQAFAVLLAERVNGLVMTDLPFFYAGGTMISDATIHVTIRDGIDFLNMLCTSLVKQGFRKIFLLDTHGPANLTYVAFARDFFEKTGIHPCHIRCGNILKSGLGLDFSDPKSYAKHQAAMYGAYKIMGLEQYLPVDPNADNSIFTRKPMEEPMRRFCAALIPLGGVPSQLFSTEQEHAGGQVFHSIEERDALCTEGEGYIKEAVAKTDIEGLVKALDEYQAYVKDVVSRVPRLKKTFSEMG